MTDGDRRIALVTGGAGGIGGGICRALAAAGHRVAVADLSLEGARAVADEIDGLPVLLDVRDPASVEAAVAGVAESAGAVEVLVNCAGWDELKPFVDVDEAFMQKVLDINLAGPMRVTRAVLSGMLQARWGRIVNIASDAGRVGSSLEAVYSGAKGGLIAFTKTVAREVARHGITANAVCPGPTDTPFMRETMAAQGNADAVLGAMVKSVPMRRLAEPQEIATAVRYFASFEAGYVTGQTLSVSGGLTMA